MKKILVPIDFSYCSLDALRYAQFLAQELGYSQQVGDENYYHQISA